MLTKLILLARKRIAEKDLLEKELKQKD